MGVTTFTFIVLAVSALGGVLATLYIQKQIVRLAPDNNIREKTNAQTRYWIAGFIAFFLATQIFENSLESRFVGESFSYIEERTRIIGIVLVLFIFFASARGIISSNLPKRWKGIYLSSFFVFVTSVISLAVLLDVLSDHYL